MQDSFTLYTYYYDILNDISLEDWGYILRAILTYADKGVVIELPPHLELAFRFIKYDLDEENKNKFCK